MTADREAMCRLVHMDNVVTGMHLAIEKFELISGSSVYPGFDLTTSYENMGLLLISAAKEMGFRGNRDNTNASGEGNNNVNPFSLEEFRGCGKVFVSLPSPARFRS